MSTREEIRSQIEECKGMIEKAQDKIDGRYFDLGEMLYRAVEGTSLDGMDALSANAIASEMDMSQTIAALKDIRKTEQEVKEHQEKIAELEAIKLCAKCGHSVEDNDLFCPVCGERIMKEGAATDDSKCPQCGGERKSDAVFCVQCGFRFAGAQNAAAPQGVMRMEAPVSKRFCYKCRAELESDASFCYVCGAKQE